MSAVESDDWRYFGVPDHWKEHGWQGTFAERFLYYGTGGLMDPKNYTLEPWALSGGGSAAFWKWNKTRWAAFGKGVLTSQSVAFAGMGMVGAIFDPLGYNEGGLDELIGDVYDWKSAFDDTATGRSVSRTWTVFDLLF